jgi:hypothetical protein
MEVTMTEDQDFLPFYQPSEVFRRLSLKYQIDDDQLTALTRDFELVPKGECRVDIISGSPPEIAKHFNLPESVIWDLLQLGVIHNPMTIGDLDFLQRYRLILEVEDGAGKSKRNPRRTKHRPDLSEAWRTFVYFRFLKNKIIYGGDGRMINPEKRIFLRSLGKEVEYRFDVENTLELRKEIKTIRVTAYTDKRKACEQDRTLADVARERGFKPETIQTYFET